MALDRETKANFWFELENLLQEREIYTDDWTRVMEYMHDSDIAVAAAKVIND